MRVHHQQAGDAVQVFGAVAGRDVEIAVHAADVHGHHDVVGVYEGGDLGQAHDPGQHPAVAAPVAAQIDEQELVFRPSASPGLGDIGLGVGGGIVGAGQWR